MKIALVLAAVLVLAGALLLPPTYVDLEKERAAVLELHRQARQAHLNGNAELLASGAADRVLELSRGQMHTITRDQLRDTFTRVFKSVKYHTWDDSAAPVVHVANDGRTAWMAVHITARVTQLAPEPKEGAFQSSWIATYEKQRDGWKMVAISSAVAPLEAAKP